MVQLYLDHLSEAKARWNSLSLKKGKCETWRVGCCVSCHPESDNLLHILLWHFLGPQVEINSVLSLCFHLIR